MLLTVRWLLASRWQLIDEGGSGTAMRTIPVQFHCSPVIVTFRM